MQQTTAGVFQYEETSYPMSWTNWGASSIPLAGDCVYVDTAKDAWVANCSTEKKFRCMRVSGKLVLRLKKISHYL